MERFLIVQGIYEEDLEYYGVKLRNVENGLDIMRDKVVATRDKEPDRKDTTKRATSPRMKTTKDETKIGGGFGNKTLTGTPNGASSTVTRRKWL